MMTWKQIRDGLNLVLTDDEPIFAIHVATGKTGLEVVRYDPTEGTIIRSPFPQELTNDQHRDSDPQ